MPTAIELIRHLRSCLDARETSATIDKSMRLLTAEGIYRTLLTSVSSYAYVIDPTCLMKYSPLDKEKKDIEKGTFAALKALDDLLGKERQFTKPIIIPIPITGRIAWVTFVILPKSYQLPDKTIAKNNQTVIYYFGSQVLLTKQDKDILGDFYNLLIATQVKIKNPTDQGGEFYIFEPFFPHVEKNKNQELIKQRTQEHIPNDGFLDLVSAMMLVLTGNIEFAQQLQQQQKKIRPAVYAAVYQLFPKLDSTGYYQQEFKKLILVINPICLHFQDNEIDALLKKEKIEDSYKDGRSIKKLTIVNLQGIPVEFMVGGLEDDNMVRLQHILTRVEYLCKGAKHFLRNELDKASIGPQKQELLSKMELIAIYEAYTKKQIQQLWQLIPSAFKDTETLLFNPTEKAVEAFKAAFEPIKKLLKSLVTQLTSLVRGNRDAKATADLIYQAENQQTALEGRPIAVTNIPVVDKRFHISEAQIPYAILTPEQMVWKAIFDVGYDGTILTSYRLQSQLKEALQPPLKNALQLMQNALDTQELNQEQLIKLEQAWQEVNDSITTIIFAKVKEHPEHLSHVGSSIDPNHPYYCNSSTIRHTEGISNAVTETLTVQTETSTVTVDLHRSCSSPPIMVENTLKRLCMALRVAKQKAANFANEKVNQEKIDILKHQTAEQPLELDITSISLLSPNVEEDLQDRFLEFQQKELGRNELRMTREDFMAKRMCHKQVFQVTIYIDGEPKQIWIKPNYTTFNQPLNTLGKAPLAPIHSFINAEGYFNFSQQMDAYILTTLNQAIQHYQLFLEIPLQKLQQVLSEINHDSKLAEQKQAISRLQQALAQQYTLLKCVLLNYQMIFLRQDNIDSKKLEQPAEKLQLAIEKLQVQICDVCKQYLLQRYAIIKKYEMDLDGLERNLKTALKPPQIQAKQQELAPIYNIADALYLSNNSLGIYMVQQTAWKQIEFPLFGTLYSKHFKIVNKIQSSEHLVELNYHQAACLILASQKLLNHIVDYYCKSGEDRTGTLTIETLARGIFRYMHGYYAEVKFAHAKKEDIENQEDQQAFDAIYDAVHEFGLSRWLTGRCQRGAVGLLTSVPGDVGKINSLIGETAKEVYKDAKKATAEPAPIHPKLLNQVLANALTTNGILLNNAQIKALNLTLQEKLQLSLQTLYHLLAVNAQTTMDLNDLTKIQQILPSINEEQSYLWLIYNFIEPITKLLKSDQPWGNLKVKISNFNTSVLGETTPQQQQRTNEQQVLELYAKTKSLFLMQKCAAIVKQLDFIIAVVSYLSTQQWDAKLFPGLDIELVARFLRRDNAAITQKLLNLMMQEQDKQINIYQLISGNASKLDFKRYKKDKAVDRIQPLFEQSVKQEFLQEIAKTAQQQLKSFKDHYKILATNLCNCSQHISIPDEVLKPAAELNSEKIHNYAMVVKVCLPLMHLDQQKFINLAANAKPDEEGAIYLFMPKLKASVSMEQNIRAFIDKAFDIGGIPDIFYVHDDYKKYKPYADAYLDQKYYGAMKPQLSTVKKPEKEESKPEVVTEVVISSSKQEEIAIMPSRVLVGTPESEQHTVYKSMPARQQIEKEEGTVFVPMPAVKRKPLPFTMEQVESTEEKENPEQESYFSYQ